MKLKVDKKHRAKTNLPRRKTIIRSTESFCSLLDREKLEREEIERKMYQVFMFSHII